MLKMTDAISEIEDIYKSLEKLFINNDKLQELQAYLDNFNPIKVMGMESMEIRHSSILAWLLSPTETHGLDDYFLKSFLAESLSRSEFKSDILSLSISAASLRDVVVRREWRDIDIFIESESNKYAFIIENKFHSKQGDTQLEGYRDDIKNYYRNNVEKGDQYQIIGIYLTLRDEPPKDMEYLPIQYSDIAAILERALKYRGTFVANEVYVFLNHYLEIITEATEMNDKQSDMQQLAKKLYQENRRAIDFIMEYGAGSEFALAIDNLIGSNVKEYQKIIISDIELVYHKSNNKQIAFLPQDWFEKLNPVGINEWTGCENWWMKLPLIVWMRLIADSNSNKGKLWLYAEVGPLSDHETRKYLINSIKDKHKANTKYKIKFGKSAEKEDTKYSKFFTKNSIDISNVTDVDEIKDKIQKLIRNFSDEFTAVTSAINKILDKIQKGSNVPGNNSV